MQQTLMRRLLQVAHDELVTTHRSVHAELESFHSRFEEQQALNDRLENDLLEINKATEHFPVGSKSTSKVSDPLSGLNLAKRVSPSFVNAAAMNLAHPFDLPQIRILHRHRLLLQ